MSGGAGFSVFGVSLIGPNRVAVVSVPVVTPIRLFVPQFPGFAASGQRGIPMIISLIFRFQPNGGFRLNGFLHLLELGLPNVRFHNRYWGKIDSYVEGTLELENKLRIVSFELDRPELCEFKESSTCKGNAAAAEGPPKRQNTMGNTSFCHFANSTSRNPMNLLGIYKLSICRPMFSGSIKKCLVYQLR